VENPEQSEQLYTQLADWWPLLSPPQDYEDEGPIYRQMLATHSKTPPQTVLELGSGGGSIASFFKQQYQLTLVDKSPDMLRVSQQVNPECRHLVGDMRTIRLNEIFDAVFIHDAIDYMTTLDDLRQAMTTAYIHCKTGGVTLIVPDCVCETFIPYTIHGGYDEATRGLRYLQWVHDPHPEDSVCIADFAFMLRDSDGQVRTVYDRHLCGLFSKAQWQQVMESVGFEVQMLLSPVESESGGEIMVFVGFKNPVL
jgi:ubiquinone/menaquinone biosynthesis C-methylase UbiE